jgi:NADH:ubiquinone oxidoreductase subunit E
MSMLIPASLAQIDKEIAKYPADQKQSAVMAALRIAQVEKGWLAPETMEFVAEYLGMPAIAVYEVATFYNMYELEPCGRHKITVCTNLPCQLQGADSVPTTLSRSSASVSAKPRRTVASPSRKASASAPAAAARSACTTTTRCTPTCRRKPSTSCWTS